MGATAYGREGIIIGHSMPISKKEIIKLFENEKSMCRIFSQREQKEKVENINGTGFFFKINNKDIPFDKCLITNNHILNEDYITKHNKINITYNNQEKSISINEKRKVFTDEELDYTIIQILDEDKIEQFFEIEQNINNKLNGNDIFILQYLNSDELLFSSGNIIAIEDNIIRHTCSTSQGSSGSPIILRHSNNIIGLHFASDKNRSYNLSTNINSIVNDIIKKEKSISIIIGEIIIKNEDINKEIRIINSYDESFRKRNFSKIMDEFKNEKNIKDCCKIKINGNLISPFQYFYKFQNEGKYIIKYSFSNMLPNINYMFSDCKLLTYMDLSNFKMQNINNIGGMFYGCNSLKSIDLSNFETQKVNNMGYLFYGCNSLKSIDLSNFDTQNVNNISYMFYGCNSLSSIDISNFKTKNVNDMNGMFWGCKSLKFINLLNFKTQNVKDMGNVFRECKSLKNIDLSSFNTEKVTNIKRMFRDCESLTNLNLNIFNTDSLKEMDDIFNGCKSLIKLNLPMFNNKILFIKNMRGIFKDCKSLTKENIETEDNRILFLFDEQMRNNQ